MEIIALLIGLALLLLTVNRMGGEARKNVREGLSAAQTIVGLSILLLGIVWYLQERPDAPRIELAIEARAYPLDYPKVLVRTVLTMKNNGRSAMALDNGQKLTFWVRQITPFDPADLEEQLSAAPPAGVARQIKQIAPATIRQDELLLNHMLETGEPQAIVYHTILNCDGQTRVLVSATLKKPLVLYEKMLIAVGLRVPSSAKDPNQYWDAETLLDFAALCTAKPEGQGV